MASPEGFPRSKTSICIFRQSLIGIHFGFGAVRESGSNKVNRGSAPRWRRRLTMRVPTTLSRRAASTAGAAPRHLVSEYVGVVKQFGYAISAIVSALLTAP